MMSLPPSVLGSSADSTLLLRGDVSMPLNSEDGDFMGGDCPDTADDVALPDDVGDDGHDWCCDEDEDFLDPVQEHDELQELLSSGPCSLSSVPSPDVAEHLSSHQDVAEFYSPSRVLTTTRRLGLRGCLSLDILTGWDFRLESTRKLSMDLLSRLCLCFLVLSPPCTIFSELQRLWNIKRMTIEVFTAKWQEGILYLTHSMNCARIQHDNHKVFVFEHPARASSWRTPEVMAIAALPGVHTIDFDQCMLGLVSHVHMLPHRKRTRLLTNSETVSKLFAPFQCDRGHVHQIIQGSEGGIRRSVWAQHYPALMVELLARGAQAHAS